MQGYGSVRHGQSQATRRRQKITRSSATTERGRESAHLTLLVQCKKHFDMLNRLKASASIIVIVEISLNIKGI